MSCFPERQWPGEEGNKIERARVKKRPVEEKRNDEAGTFFRFFSPNPSPLPKVRKVNHAREETSQESAAAEDRRQRSERRGRPEEQDSGKSDATTSIPQPSAVPLAHSSTVVLLAFLAASRAIERRLM